MKTKNPKDLTHLQEYVTCQGGTEKPFDNDYWNHKEEGIYIDLISGQPLFASIHKFDSGTGWPSFTQPIDHDHVKEIKDHSHGMIRVEVKSKHSDAHLGHVFPDGIKSAGGLRYCINSASLDFIPKDKMIDAGYGDYLNLFENEEKK
jgi:peptide-methionine (R)-S-oxide reductase